MSVTPHPVVVGDSPVEIRSPRDAPDRLWLASTLAGSVLFILAVTLFPYGFEAPDVVDRDRLLPRFDWSPVTIGGLGDFTLNVLLFVPVGFATTGLLRQRNVTRRAALGAAIGASAALSGGIELLQIFLPSRNATLGDVIANAAGGAAGFASFVALGRTFSALIIAMVYGRGGTVAPRKLAAAYLGYAVVVLGLSARLAASSAFRTWDPTLPLVLGNERTGDRPWKGSISRLLVADRAMSAEQIHHIAGGQGGGEASVSSLVAFYPLEPGQPLREVSGNLPNLEIQGEWLRGGEAVAGRFGTTTGWLASTEAGARISERLRGTSQFTISAVLATSDVNQGGPARIFSISRDPWTRNLTIAQEADRLIVRIRSPLTGPDGTTPAIYLPSAFPDHRPRTMTLTFDGRVLRCTMEGAPAAAMDFSPELAPLRWLTPREQITCEFDDPHVRYWRPLYLILALGPLGAIAALFGSVSTLRVRSRLMAVAAMTLASPVILTLTLSAAHSKPVASDQLISGVCISVTMVLLCSGWISLFNAVRGASVK